MLFFKAIMKATVVRKMLLDPSRKAFSLNYQKSCQFFSPLICSSFYIWVIFLKVGSNYLTNDLWD